MLPEALTSNVLPVPCSAIARNCFLCSASCTEHSAWLEQVRCCICFQRDPALPSQGKGAVDIRPSLLSPAALSYAMFVFLHSQVSNGNHPA